MVGRGLVAALMGLTVVFASAARGAPAQGLERAKRATALVKVSADGKQVGSGTAFCIDEAGYFVTNAHVVENRREVDLVLEPGEKAQRVEAATVLRSDAGLDLALLQVTRGGTFAALPLGRSDGLQETMAIMAVGYPFGGQMSLDKDDFPAVSINKGSITSLRKKAGELELIQVDAALNPGNSGGPVLDAEGQVIGIVKSGIVGAGVNFAIPVQRLGKLLKEPLVSVAPTTLAYDKRAEPQQVAVKLVSMERPVPVYTVELTLRAGESGAPRVLTAQTRDGACTFTVPLAPAGAAPTGDSLVISGTFEDGTITGRTADRALQVAGQRVMLADVREITFNAEGLPIFSARDRVLTGTARDLDGVPVTIGGASVKPNWAKANKIVIASGVRPVRSVEYTVKARVNDRSIAPVSGSFALSGAPDAADGGPGAVATASLWSYVRAGLAEHRDTKSRSHGGAFSMKDPYTDVPEEPGVLVGFNCTLGKFINTPTIEGLQAIYMTERGEKLGPLIGKSTPTAKRVQAKRGYVVTEIRIRAGGNLDGIGVTFTRLEGTRLVKDDSYNGEWIGAREGGSEVTIDTKGGVPVGITGKRAEKVGSLAMVILPPEDAAIAKGKADAPPSRTEAPGPRAPAAPAPPASGRVEQPAAGEPYTSFEQMFDTLPPDLQPAGGRWFVGTRVSPELSHRLENQPLRMTGEFASAKPNGKDVELVLDAPAINYRGFQFSGQILAKFPGDQAARFKAMRIHDKVTIEGKVHGVVVRGTTPQGQVINKCFVWIEECEIK